MDWQHFVQSLVFAMAESCWMAAFCWIIIQGILSLFSLSPQKIYVLAISAYILIFFSWLYALGRHCMQAAPTLTLPIPDAMPMINLDAYPRVIELLAFFYLAGIGITGMRYLHAGFLVRKLAVQKQAVPATWETLVHNLQEELNITRSIRLGHIHYTTTPLTFGWIQPVILFPVASINQLSMAEARAVILHELAHIRRNDYLHECILSWMDILLFCNPFAKQLLHIIRAEREKACDDIVMQQGTEKLDYITALSWCAQHTYSVQAALGISGKDTQLLTRIKRIAAQPVTAYRLKPLSLLAAITILMSGIFFSKQANQASTQETASQLLPKINTASSSQVLHNTQLSVEKAVVNSNRKKISSPGLPSEQPKIPTLLSAANLANSTTMVGPEEKAANTISWIPVADVSFNLKKLIQLMKQRMLLLPNEERNSILAASFAQLTQEERKDIEQSLRNYLFNTDQSDNNPFQGEAYERNQTAIDEALPTIVHPKITLKLFTFLWNEINNSPSWQRIHLLNPVQGDSLQITNDKLRKPDFE